MVRSPDSGRVASLDDTSRISDGRSLTQTRGLQRSTDLLNYAPWRVRLAVSVGPTRWSKGLPGTSDRALDEGGGS
jgi:hypothetical protein